MLSLGLGIGTNLALLAAINALFMHMPSARDGSTLVGIEPGNGNLFSYPNYRDLRDSGLLPSVAAWGSVRPSFGNPDERERISGLAVTANFFETLGIGALRGRLLISHDSDPHIAVISHSSWQRALVVISRTPEIGLRRALGASSQQVIWEILRQSLKTVALGAALGTVLFLVVTRSISAVLAGVSSADPLTLSAVVLLFLSSSCGGVLECYEDPRARKSAGLALAETLPR